MIEVKVTRLEKKNRKQTYPKKIAEYIHKRYSADDETALINNYLADPQTHAKEYEEYQSYRNEVKTAVKEAYDS